MTSNNNSQDSSPLTDDLKKRSFARSLALGDIEENLVFPFPKMKDSEKEILKPVMDSFKAWLGGKETDFREWDKNGEIPEDFIEEMRDFGLFSFIIPEEFGGLGLSSTAYSRVMQELVRYDGSVCLTAGAHSSIGMRGLVMFGTAEQKAKYLPKLATGEMIAAYCLTEAGAGSDAASIKTKATKEGDHWILHGEKIWITNGGIANFFTVFARTDTPEGKITAFIVTRDMAGVSHGPHEDKMGIRGSNTCTVSFDNVKIPVENVLGEVGKGFKIAVKILNNGRTGLGGGCVGGMKKCIQLATHQAKERTQFGRSISEFGLIKEKVGRMVVDCYVTESLVNMVSGLIDQGYEDFAVEAAISKVYASDALWRVSDEALQIAGGNGYMREFPYEKMMRDCRINKIFEGTNDILQLFIALTSLQDAGQLLKDLSKAVNLGNVLSDPIKGFGLAVQYGRMRMANTTGIGMQRLTKVHPALETYARAFENHVSTVSNVADKLLRRHGKSIFEKQFALKRLALMVIDAYAMICVISRVSQAVEEKGIDHARYELDILKIFSSDVNLRITQNVNGIDDNDDELIKELASHAFEAEGYTWDNI